MSCATQCLSAAVPLKITQQEEQAASKMETASAITHQGMPGSVWAVDKTEHVWGQERAGSLTACAQHRHTCCEAQLGPELALIAQ